MNSELPWSVIMKYRNEASEQYPSIWRIEVVRGLMDIVKREVKQDDAVLDVGASERRLDGILKAWGFRGVYKSMDIDRSIHQDYYSLSEVTERFDVVAMTEVIEHIPQQLFLDLLDQFKTILKKGGKLIVSTPNIFNPYAFSWGGPAHISAYPYEEMAALALYKGYTNIRLYRACADEPLKWRVAFRILGPFLNKYLGVDFARTIVMTCQLPLS